MRSVLSPSRYADPPVENLMVRDEYWQDDDWDEEEEYEEDDIEDY